MKKAWWNDRKTEQYKDEELVEKLKRGETLTASELAYTAANWSPAKQALNLARFAGAKTRNR